MADAGPGGLPPAPPPPGPPVVRVACGVLRRADGAVLVATRPGGKVAAGKWEFPGGKIEPGETPGGALARELDEELGVTVTRCRPLIAVSHAYAERTVWLETFLVTGWQGQPAAREGQQLAWVRPDGLHAYDLLAADGPIVTALRLPSWLAITPGEAPLADLVARLDRLPPGCLARLRRPGRAADAYRNEATAWLDACAARGLVAVLDLPPDAAAVLGAPAIALPEAARAGFDARARAAFAGWVIASAHDAAGLADARARGCDAATLSPVRPTQTHPGAAPLGWGRFGRLARGAGLPVYALGGLAATRAERLAAWDAGGQGVAGVSGFW